MNGKYIELIRRVYAGVVTFAMGFVICMWIQAHECKHKWSKWHDLKFDSWRATQTRECSICGRAELRVVQ